MGIGGDERHAGEPVSAKGAERRRASRSGLLGGEFEPEDLAIPLGVPPRQEHVELFGAALLADLHDEHVGPARAVGTALEWRPRNAANVSSRLAAISPTWFFDS